MKQAGKGANDDVERLSVRATFEIEEVIDDAEDHAPRHRDDEVFEEVAKVIEVLRLDSLPMIVFVGATRPYLQVVVALDEQLGNQARHE